MTTVRVREFDMEKDSKAVEEMERRCEVGPPTTVDAAGKKRKKKRSTSLYVDLLGDPLSRVRHAAEHVMLVAEYGEKKEMAGVIRACIKLVTRGREAAKNDSLPPDHHYVKIAYILGLRVSPHHRRLGIGTKLVERVETWCAERGAEYAYMATDSANSASINLFTRRLSYARFRSPALLAHPVHSHLLPVSRKAAVLRLPPSAAAALYSRLFPPSAVEFLPSDLASLLSHPLTVATFLAVASSPAAAGGFSLAGGLPSSFAVMSLWDSTRVLRLQVAGATPAARAALALLRAVDARAPWMRVPSIRDVFRPFGVYIMYGLHMAGPEGPRLMRSLCRLAHNAAVADENCAAVVAEVGRGDPVRSVVPHWKRFSCEEDVWCMKRLRDGGGGDDDWLATPPETEVIFVDPREF
ncbi:putative N-acetyltransferase HLS1 [Canna indica]|uniref:N-acetyltransferase HLS1 n=1 Tax=Canna indica TaxID=4628 RepID=A0AAQ3JU59_9LILI|nr:putative N-acetyltransferase HLS1 [Canna indica]